METSENSSRELMIQALESLEKCPDFHRLYLPKFYCDAKGIDYWARIKPPTLKELIDNGFNPAPPKPLNNVASHITTITGGTEEERIHKLEAQLEEVMAKLSKLTNSPVPLENSTH